MGLPLIPDILGSVIRTSQPFVGMIVWYYAYGTPGGEYPAGVPRAALVTQIHPLGEDRYPSVGLCILNPTGMFFNPVVEYGKRPGGWSFVEVGG